jgi:hypothetical protein
MRSAALLLLFAHILPAATVPLERKGAYIIVGEVWVNGRGPFRFLVDTGAQSVAVSERVAIASRLTAHSRVELVTAAGARLVNAAHARTLSVAGATVEGVEVLIDTLDAVRRLDAGIDGVLGQSFLRHLDYLIDFKRGELTVGGDSPPGAALSLRYVDGRPALEGQIGGAPRALVIDSGAPALILFSRRSHRHQTALVSTNAGHTAGTAGVRLIGLGGRQHRLFAVEIPGDADYGLLPASAFRSVYVCNSRGYVVLAGR